MKGFAFEAVIGLTLIFIVLVLMYTLAPAYLEFSTAIQELNNNITRVNNTIDFGQTGIIMIGWSVIIGLIIWMIVSSQREEFDSGIID